MKTAILHQINNARSERRPAVVVTEIATGAQDFHFADQTPVGPLGDEIRKRLKSAKSGTVIFDSIEYFIQVHVPVPRMVIIGAVHISQALAPLAKACEFDVTVIDPRTAFATQERFPDIELIADWPAEILPDNPLDAYTALVAVTHDPKIDDLPLQSALDANCFYTGALGSRKTHAKRAIRFADAGYDEKAIAPIHAPIGLDIGASNPTEIAVAVMGQVIETLRKGPGN